jgi:hypothetical protein
LEWLAFQELRLKLNLEKSKEGMVNAIPRKNKIKRNPPKIVQAQAEPKKRKEERLMPFLGKKKER